MSSENRNLQDLQINNFRLENINIASTIIKIIKIGLFCAIIYIIFNSI